MARLANFDSSFLRDSGLLVGHILMTATGNIRYVDSGNALAATDVTGTKDRPYSTVDSAIGSCTANNGDVIVAMAGHSETLTAAASIAADIAGVQIVGLGTGRERPTINYTTAAAASLNVTAANVSITNFFFDMTGVDAVTAGINVSAADFTFAGNEVLMADSGGQAVLGILGAAGADRMKRSEEDTS